MASLPLGTIPKDLNNLTPAWLDAALQISGFLTKGQVLSVNTVIGKKWHIAQTACVSVHYSSDADPGLPHQLFIKLAVFDDPFEVILPGECAFYQLNHPAALPIPRCFGAYFDPVTKLSCVILQDLSKTHEATPWPHQLTVDRCRAAVDALAGFHGHYWYVPGKDNGPAIDRLIENETIMQKEFDKLLPAFFDSLDDQLSDERRNLVKRALHCFPELKEQRLREGRPTTIVHGDPHAWNVMFPIQQTQPLTCLFIDWEDWRFDSGVADLAYMMALSWYPERRERLEKELLHRYQDQLAERTGASYSRDHVMLDYRIGLIQHVVVPLYLHQLDVGDIYWTEQLERWFMAMTDLQCEELL